MTREAAVTYVDVNGLATWHEVRGEGEPVVLLHGAFAGASSRAAQAPALARAGYKVHLPERRGHAHTPDVAGPLTHDVMVDDDTVAYLDAVVGGPAHLVGWSDGAMATTRLPSTTGSGPFSFWIISLAASTTLIDGEAVAGSEVMTSRTLGILFASFNPRLGVQDRPPARDRPKPEQPPLEPLRSVGPS
jgi:pimeloyl-ACP methyl ester carboxylesterase